MKIKKQSWLILLVILSLSLIVQYSNKASCAEKLNISIGWQPSPPVAFHVGKAVHLFEEAGLNPKYSKFTAGPPFLAALASGDIDVAFGGIPPIIHGINGGLDLRVIISGDDQSISNGLVVPKGSPIKSFKDQKGKKIGFPFGSSAHWAFLESLRQNNIKGDEVEILNLAPSVAVAALAKGDIDGLWVWSPWTITAEERANAILIKNWQDLGSLNPGVWYVRNDFLMKNPEAIQRLIKANDLANEYIKRNREKSAKIFAPEIGLSDKAALRMVDTNPGIPIDKQLMGHKYSMGTYTTKAETDFAKTFVSMNKFLYEQGKIKSIPSIIEFIDPRPMEIYLFRKHKP